MIVPTIELEVIGARKRQKITALIDTGFTGYLSLPSKVAIDLGLELVGQEEVQQADGQWVNQLFFDGKVRFLKQTQN